MNLQPLRACPDGVMPVTMPVYGEVELWLLPYNAIRIRRVDAAGVFNEIGLREGDVVVRINGSALSGPSAELQTAFAKAGETGAVHLHVRRAGSILGISATREQWGKLSGHWTACVRVPE